MILKYFFNTTRRAGRPLFTEKEKSQARRFHITPQHGRRWQGTAAANVPSAPSARLAFNPHQIRAAAGGISASAEHRSPRSGRGAQRLC